MYIPQLNQPSMFCTLPKRQVSLAQTTQAIETFALQQANYSIQVAYTLEAVADIWARLQPERNIFLQVDYLRALEMHPPARMKFCYVIFYKDNEPVGFSYNQIFYVDAAESVQDKKEVESEGSKRACFLHTLRRSVSNWVVRRSNFDLLVCGNILLTGAYGYYFGDAQHQEPTLQMQLVKESLNILPRILKEQINQNISINFVKDYPIEQSQVQTKSLQKDGYHPFMIQPCMRIELRPHWQTFDNYIDDMHSKYRVRARRALKKGQEIEKRELNVGEIEAHISEIYHLYKLIADGVGFNAFTLHERYFLALKQHLGDNFRLVGYFLDGKMIAFYTGILNGDEMEAHFLGVDASTNHSHQTYLNILYDLVRMGIYYQKKVVDFARTALEIKSSVGAVAHDMYCYMRHRNVFSSRLLQFLINRFNPKENWQPRHPFKDDVHEEVEGGGSK
jgi:hypothetical protein